MSFEGYYQMICKNGHLFSEGVDYSWNETKKAKCPDCGEGVAWWNLVDDTNCDQYGEIPISEFKKLTDRKVETCPTCNHQHVVAWETYEIPVGKGRLVNNDQSSHIENED